MGCKNDGEINSNKNKKRNEHLSHFNYSNNIHSEKKFK